MHDSAGCQSASGSAICHFVHLNLESRASRCLTRINLFTLIGWQILCFIYGGGENNEFAEGFNIILNWNYIRIRKKVYVVFKQLYPLFFFIFINCLLMFISWLNILSSLVTET